MLHRDFTRLLQQGTGVLLLAAALTCNAAGQTPLSTTRGINSNQEGVFDNSRFFQPNQFLVGGETPAQVWGVANKFADGITSVVRIPPSSVVYQANALNGFADNFSTTTAGVAGYFTARCSAKKTLCWGINPQVADRSDAGPMDGIILYGQETDIVVENPDTQVNGLAILGHFDAQPKSAWALKVVAAPGPTRGRWKVGYTTEDGAISRNGSGLALGATDPDPNSYSQILSLSGVDATRAHRIATLQATPAGGLNLATTAGTLFTFQNGPVALSTLPASTSNTACLNSSTESGLYLIAMCSALRKYAENISDLTAGVGEVTQLKPVSYTSKTSGKAEIGFIAEDVETVDERLATYDGGGHLAGVQYDHIVALLTKALQEQQAQIADLQQQVRKLQARR